MTSPLHLMAEQVNRIAEQLQSLPLDTNVAQDVAGIQALEGSAMDLIVALRERKRRMVSP